MLSPTHKPFNSFTSAQLEHLSSVADNAASAAGKLVVQLRAQLLESNFSKNNNVQNGTVQNKSIDDKHVDYKNTGDSIASQVVTEVDRQSERLILDLLSSASAQYDLGLLTEEQEDDGSRFEKDYFWCVDPLDGTLPFIEGKSGYAVSIALVSRCGEPILAAIYAPCEAILYSACKGRGLFRNGERFSVRLDAKHSGQYALLFDRSMFSQAYYDVLIDRCEHWARARGYEGVSAKCAGGAVLNAMHVLEHGSGAYFKLPKAAQGGGSLWDFAATACCYREAGLHVSDMFGEPLAFNQASVFMNQCGVLYTVDQKSQQWLLSLSDLLK